MKRIIPYILLAGLLTNGCEILQKDILPEEGFTKIYNHPEETLSFYPESVIELGGDGYIFVSAVKDEESEVEYPYAYLTRVNASGELEWSLEYSWLSPCSNLIKQGNSTGFIAMNQQFQAYFVEIDPASGEELSSTSLGMTMPLYAFSDKSGNIVVLGYDFVSRSSWVAKYNSNLTLERSTLLSINDDLEYEVQRHLNKTGQSYPFFIGEFDGTAGPGYYVNCFYNYTLRCVFLDASSMGTTGNLYSFRTEEGISSMLYKSGSLFGMTSYYEGNNYILPETEVNVNSSDNIKDWPANPLYELTFKAKVLAGEIATDSADYELFVSQTNSNSLVMYKYAMESDSLLATIYKEFDERLEVKDFIQTADKGIVVLARIYILGKYQRPMLIKFPPETFLPEKEKGLFTKN